MTEFSRGIATTETRLTPLDPQGNPRRAMPSRPLQLYGSPLAQIPGGMPRRGLPKTSKRTVAKQQRPQTLLAALEAGGTVEATYKEEILRRAVAASKQQISERCRRGGLIPGLVERVENQVCHICHLRRANSALFACGHGHHFCDEHCKVRVSTAAKSWSVLEGLVTSRTSAYIGAWACLCQTAHLCARAPLVYPLLFVK